jgi:hypothetical protein
MVLITKCCVRVTVPAVNHDYLCTSARYTLRLCPHVATDRNLKRTDYLRSLILLHCIFAAKWTET